jgi:hypothetical protein
MDTRLRGHLRCGGERLLATSALRVRSGQNARVLVGASLGRSAGTNLVSQRTLPISRSTNRACRTNLEKRVKMTK